MRTCIERPNSNLTIWSSLFFFHRGLPFWQYYLSTSLSPLQFVCSLPFFVEACLAADLPPLHMFVVYMAEKYLSLIKVLIQEL